MIRPARLSMSMKVVLSKAILAGLVLHNLACAAEWSVEPSLRVKEEYNDNIHFTTAPHASVWGTYISPSVRFGRHTETLDVAGGAGLSVNRYSGETGLDTNDQTLSFDSTYKMELDRIGLDASYKRDSTLSSELLTTGVVQVRKQRKTLSVNPNWTHLFTERSSMKLDYQLQSSRYEDAANTGLVDYDNQSISLAWLYAMSEKDQLSVSAYTARFETRPATYKSDSDGFQLGLTRAFSESLKGSVSVGTRSTHSVVSQNVTYCEYGALFICQLFGIPLTTVAVVTETNSRGSLINASLEQSYESARLYARVGREVNPSGNGSLVESDKFDLGLNNSFSQTFSGNLNISLVDSRYLNGVLTRTPTHYYSIGGSLNWKLSEWWNLDTGFRHSVQDSSSGRYKPTQSLVYAAIIYNWPKLSISR